MHFRQLRKELSEIFEILRTRCGQQLLRRGYFANIPHIPRHSRQDYEHLLSRPVREAPFVVLDTETTGFEPYGGDALVQIALIEYRGLTPTGREYCSLIRPGIPIPARSTAIHGISAEMVADAPAIDEIIGDVVDFTAGHVLVGHHVDFDMRFLNRVTRRCLLGDFPNPRIDTAMLHLAAGGARDAIDLDQVATACAITIDGRHDARSDALACGEIFACYARQLTTADTRTGELLDRVHPVIDLALLHPAASTARHGQDAD